MSFAKDELARGRTALQAALDAGFTRFRPVLMTALAMIIGMLPMALGLGEGGEQNAPLGRAVIGGLALATVATLFFVPAVFALLHRRARRFGDTRMTPADTPASRTRLARSRSSSWRSCWRPRRSRRRGASTAAPCAEDADAGDRETSALTVSVTR